MRPDEIHKLLGGYATHTLTDAERNLLFSAALQDQELFDALADEEILRELLADPGTRQTLIGRLERQPVLGGQPRDVEIPEVVGAEASASGGGPALARSHSTLGPRIWAVGASRRFAIAGGLAIILLVAGGLQYWRLHAPSQATIDLAMSRAPELPRGEPQPSDLRPDASARASLDSAKSRPPTLILEAPAPAPLSQGVPPKLPPPSPASDERDQKVADAGRADAGPARERATNESRANIVESEKAVVKEEPSRQSTAATAEASANRSEPLQTGRPAPRSPAPAVTGEVRPATPSPLSSLSLRSAPGFIAGNRSLDAKVTGVNGTIVSINAGVNAGLSAGDTVEILRDGRVISTVKLTEVGATSAAGRFEGLQDSSAIPRSGDAVRRAAPRPPR